MMLSNEVFNEMDRGKFDSCCEYYETCLTHFGFEVKAHCFIDENQTPALYLVDIYYCDQRHEIFTALTLQEFYEKVLLLCKVYDCGKTHMINIEEALQSLLEKDSRLAAIRGEIEDLLNWIDYIDEEFVLKNIATARATVSNNTLH
ncbi:MAG: hypothetical protein ACO2ZM_01335 [Francisellaceae bacterium]